MATQITIEEMAAFCKRKGFVYPSSEIYGGMAGFWDYGPLGSELFNNIKQSFLKHFVQTRDNMLAIEASIISHPRTWKASGHIENFGDLVLTCSKCKNKLRADHYIDEKININVEGRKVAEINEIIRSHGLKCPKCNGDFEELKKFNLLFETRVGAVEDKSAVAYLRGETAQGMFLNFKSIVDTNRVKLPFGILQMGRCFRNEIAPRDFIFRCREFTIGEFEFFLHPNMTECSAMTQAHLSLKLPILTAETQEADRKDMEMISISDMIKAKRLAPWHAYWLAEQVLWFQKLGLSINNLKIRQHTKSELSHYSSATFDLDYLYPFGSHEIAGNADRGQYDLGQHAKESGLNLTIFDEESKAHIVPHVLEPTFGLDRVFLAVLVEAYNYDKARENVVLKLEPRLAPYKAGIFPLVGNKPELVELSKSVYADLIEDYPVLFDKSGTVGKRYARMDEIGTPFCITVDFDSLQNKDVTIRDRDSTEQKRIKISDLKDILQRLVQGKMKFSDIK